MEKINEIDEAQYKVDLIISDNYIKFSGELLRLSLLAIGGFGTLTILNIKGEDKLHVFANPIFLILSLVCFVICSSAALCHRYYATDTISWYISWLRAEKIKNEIKADKEKKGFYKLLKYSRISLITCEISFGIGVVFFFIAIVHLFICK